MRKGFPLKPEDSPSEPAADLALYFQTRAYEREVQRQAMSHATQLAMRARQREMAAELAAYWTDADYAHAAAIAAATDGR